MLSYVINQADDPALYFAESQKIDSEPIQIKYLSVPVTEVIQDFKEVSYSRLQNNRQDLDTILVNISAKSISSKFSYGKIKILDDLQDIYDFKIVEQSQKTNSYEIKIIDQNKLKSFREEMEGGGMVKSEGDSLKIIRLSLDNLSNFFESKLKTPVIYQLDNQDKFSFKLKKFKALEELNKQLKEHGLYLEKTQSLIEFITIH